MAKMGDATEMVDQEMITSSDVGLVDANVEEQGVGEELDNQNNKLVKKEMETDDGKTDTLPTDVKMMMHLSTGPGNDNVTVADGNPTLDDGIGDRLIEMKRKGKPMKENKRSYLQMTENKSDAVASHQADPHRSMEVLTPKVKHVNARKPRNWLNEEIGGITGTPAEVATFMKELESFHRENALDYKPLKFYGEPLNCLKLWRSVIRLGGYDVVTGSKLWRNVGETFNPPKTCTTVSFTFRIFYEKVLLEFEKHMRQIGELPALSFTPLPIVAKVTGGPHATGSGGRQRRDSAARAMQGWHAQRLLGSGEVGEPFKDKMTNSAGRREKHLKHIGSGMPKHKIAEKPMEMPAYRQLIPEVLDIGHPADWVKINVRETRTCFEVYALIPGLLRDEIRVQSDPAGRLVITGQPEQIENPWGITPFKKVVTLPGRVDPLGTTAIVSYHGRLLVRIPFERESA
ncbi:hypothetical protein ACFE04_008865 [Oxalis oulophora]